MRVKDLRGKGCFIWPPEWAARLEGDDKEWILTKTNLHTGDAQPYIDIEAVCGSDSQKGVILLENLEHLKILYQILHDNIGKPLTEIGDITITF